MSKIDITAHAEAILRASLAAALVDPKNPKFLAAVTAAFDAGALAMREAAARCSPEYSGDTIDDAVDDYCEAIRAIDPATLRGVGS